MIYTFIKSFIVIYTKYDSNANCNNVNNYK